MPVIAATGNIIWEFLWAFVFPINLGILAVWGVRFWFILDVVINTSLFFYGSKQTIIPEFKKGMTGIIIFLLAAWAALLYSFIYMKLDNGMGAVTAMISNVIMSALYIIMIFRKPDLWRISVRTAWYKFLGTGSITAIAVHIPSFRHNYFLMSLGALAFVLDVYYIYLLSYLKSFRRKNKTHSLQKRDEILKDAGFNPLSKTLPITSN
jgi:hypothetical protein